MPNDDKNKQEQWIEMQDLSGSSEQEEPAVEQPKATAPKGKTEQWIEMQDLSGSSEKEEPEKAAVPQQPQVVDINAMEPEVIDINAIEPEDAAPATEPAAKAETKPEAKEASANGSGSDGQTDHAPAEAERKPREETEQEKAERERLEGLLQKRREEIAQAQENINRQNALAQDPPEKPNLWKQIMHYLNSDWYAEDFKQYEAEKRSYDARAKENEKSTGYTNAQIAQWQKESEDLQNILETLRQRLMEPNPAAQQETAPEQTAPEQTAPQQTVPQQVTPQQGAPQKTEPAVDTNTVKQTVPIVDINALEPETTDISAEEPKKGVAEQPKAEAPKKDGKSEQWIEMQDLSGSSEKEQPDINAVGQEQPDINAMEPEVVDINGGEPEVVDINSVEKEPPVVKLEEPKVEKDEPQAWDKEANQRESSQPSEERNKGGDQVQAGLGDQVAKGTETKNRDQARGGTFDDWLKDSTPEQRREMAQKLAAMDNEKEMSQPEVDPAVRQPNEKMRSAAALASKYSKGNNPNPATEKKKGKRDAAAIEQAKRNNKREMNALFDEVEKNGVSVNRNDFIFIEGQSVSSLLQKYEKTFALDKSPNFKKEFANHLIALGVVDGLKVEVYPPDKDLNVVNKPTQLTKGNAAARSNAMVNPQLNQNGPQQQPQMAAPGM